MPSSTNSTLWERDLAHRDRMERIAAENGGRAVLHGSAALALLAGSDLQGPGTASPIVELDVDDIQFTVFDLTRRPPGLLGPQRWAVAVAPALAGEPACSRPVGSSALAQRTEHGLVVWRSGRWQPQRLVQDLRELLQSAA